MTISPTDLEQIARLAHLDADSEQSSQLSDDITAIMNFVEQLRAVNTTNIAPLFHPFDLHQRVRSDEVTEEDCLAELSAIAPLFEDNLYLVPKVIDSSN